MVFNIEGKIALITGGASGLGLAYAKELLRNGAKGVTLADVDSKLGNIALSQINEEFGLNKAAFIKTDVTNIQEFEDAFKKTISTFKNIDILINNAGILNDALWEKEIAINVNGVVHGMLLGIDNYLPKYKQGEEAVIVNISSVIGIAGFEHVPVYSATKFAIVGMSKSWGTPYHFKRSGVRVVVVCPGATETTLLAEMSGKDLGEVYNRVFKINTVGLYAQDPGHVAKEMIKVIQGGPNGTIWIVEDEEPAYEFLLNEREKITRNYLSV